MLFEGQPVTAYCGTEYLCIVKGNIRGDNFATVEVIARIDESDNLIVEAPYLESWYVDIGDNSFDRANRLYSDYLELTGANSKFSKEEIQQYSIRGRLM